jgi:hypothetical protein
MTQYEALKLIVDEVTRATKKFPTWPTRALDAAGIVNEEVGELNKEVLQLTYEPHKSDRVAVAAEAVQAGAMLVRFLMSTDRYDYAPGVQHAQDDSDIPF